MTYVDVGLAPSGAVMGASDVTRALDSRYVSAFLNFNISRLARATPCDGIAVIIRGMP